VAGLSEPVADYNSVGPKSGEMSDAPLLPHFCPPLLVADRGGPPIPPLAAPLVIRRHTSCSIYSRMGYLPPLTSTGTRGHGVETPVAVSYNFHVVRPTAAVPVN